MILSLSNQGTLFLLTIIIGISLGFIYDIFRVLRKIIYHKNFITYIEDALYWIIATSITAYVLLHRNYLEIRFYSLLGICLGLIFYFSLISFYIMKIIFFIIGIIKKIIYIILKPLIIFLKILSPIYKKININSKKINNRKKIVLQKFKLYGKMKGKRTLEHIRIIKNKI